MVIAIAVCRNEDLGIGGRLLGYWRAWALTNAPACAMIVSDQASSKECLEMMNTAKLIRVWSNARAIQRLTEKLMKDGEEMAQNDVFDCELEMAASAARIQDTVAS